MCCAGAALLLRSERAGLSDEVCTGSFGNHQAEPALDGQEPAYAAKISVIQEVPPVSPLLTGNWGMLSRQQRCLHYRRTVSLDSCYPGERLCSACVYKVFYFLRLVLWVVLISSGWLWLCVWQESVRCKHSLLTFYAIDQTSPLQLSYRPHVWADNYALHVLLLLSLLSGT